MAHVEAVCLSHKKGIVKKEQPQVVVLDNWGIDGDAHAGDWHRQVSLLAGDLVVLEITQIDKECHNSGCAIKKATGDCIMPREGIFARVIKGGVVVKDDSILKQTQ